MWWGWFPARRNPDGHSPCRVSSPPSTTGNPTHTPGHTPYWLRSCRVSPGGWVVPTPPVGYRTRRRSCLHCLHTSTSDTRMHHRMHQLCCLGSCRVASAVCHEVVSRVSRFASRRLLRVCCYSRQGLQIVPWSRLRSPCLLHSPRLPWKSFRGSHWGCHPYHTVCRRCRTVGTVGWRNPSRRPSPPVHPPPRCRRGLHSRSRCCRSPIRHGWCSWWCSRWCIGRIVCRECTTWSPNHPRCPSSRPLSPRWCGAVRFVLALSYYLSLL